MLSTSSLLASLAFALLAAGLSGAVAARLGQSVIVGYIIAGVFVGPYTPGFVADGGSVDALAEIGVVLLLFVTGMEVSARELARAGRVALAGALGQVLLLVGAGYLVGQALGWGPTPSLVLGCVVSNSSSTVLSKVLGERGEGAAPHARLALAWSSIQDLTTIVIVVMFTAIASDSDNLAGEVALEVGKASIFLLILVPVGSRFLPVVFTQIRAIRQREVFVLSAAALGLMTAWIATLFGLSPAIGAFVAGVVLGESDIRHEVIDGLGTLRDVFVGLFFVSIGMLVDPAFLWSYGGLVLVVVALIVPFKGAVVALIVWAFRVPARTGVLTSAALAQSAEFSFLLATVGSQLGIINGTEFSALIAGATLSVLVSPALLHFMNPVANRVERYVNRGMADDLPHELLDVTRRNHAIVCGHGRVGRVVVQALRDQGQEVVVIDQDVREVVALREDGIVAFLGSVDNQALLEKAGVGRAALLVIAVSDRASVRRVARFGRHASGDLVILARTHEVAERDYLEANGVQEAVVGELELAVELARYALRICDVDPAEVEEYLHRVRYAEAEAPTA